jgi:Nif-specific regulatory protein
MFKALYEISQLLNSILNTEKLLEKVMDVAIESVNAERGFIVLTDDVGNLKVEVARHMEGALEKELSELSQSAFKEMLKKREPKIYIDAQTAFPKAESVMLKHIKSIACVPLICKDELLGGIYIDTRTEQTVFDDNTLQFLTAFANIASLAITNARLYQSLISENISLKKVFNEWREFPEILSQSENMKRVYELMNHVIPTDATVLIVGETGTGKELVARAIHYNGPRKNRPFITVNCSAIPQDLLESELFGYKKGSFTGAITDRKGLFEAAHGGTLFLDEISDLPLPLQPKILRVLQNGEIRILGDTSNIYVNVRIISATHRNLARLVTQQNFREDLYYRLNVVRIDLPPLRNRREDIPLLVNYFIKKYSQKLGKGVTGISKQALNHLSSHNWPGNIRELENVIECAIVLCKGKIIEDEDLELKSINLPHLEGNKTLAAIEKREILERLKQFSGNRKSAAESLGISLRTLQYKLSKWQGDETTE